MENFWLTRAIFQRSMGIVYLIAFVVALNQFRPLLGEHGLLPAPVFMKQIPFWRSPSLFYAFPYNAAFTAAAWIGIILSCLAITGLSDRYSVGVSIAVWGGLWVLYLSFVNVGQTFYGFGWESLLVEAGFYTMFLGPSHVMPPKVTVWLLRWLVFRVIFGAGLIKLRGDPCWKDLTCLNYHYETQPMPNPLSWYFHWAPEWTRKGGVMVNHFAELIAPLGYFIPGIIGMVAGLVTIGFQTLILLSGNLSWLNFLTLVLSIPVLDDRVFRAILSLPAPFLSASFGLQVSSGIVGALIAVLSINPIRNMISPKQMMNFSYNPFHLAGTYGAFGGITRSRYEIIIEGTDEAVVTAATRWKEYSFKGKPGDVSKRPPVIAPYHLRIDWLMWFAAMSGYENHPWFVHLIVKLLRGDREMLSLMGVNPFPDKPPRFVRAEVFAYRFTTPTEHRQTGAWWVRERAGQYFPPVSLENPAFKSMITAQGWLQ